MSAVIAYLIIGLIFFVWLVHERASPGGGGFIRLDFAVLPFVFVCMLVGWLPIYAYAFAKYGAPDVRKEVTA